ncbi:MAG: DNA-directed RNA polymerase subunit A' [Candidatus Anstonellaceae archaeon]
MLITKEIDKIKFSLFSPEMIRKMSVVKITVPDTYNDDSYPIEGGLVDQRMGVIDPGLTDKTSGGKAGTSPGHFGHIELVRPVIHPEFAKIILYVLQNTSPYTKRILWSAEQLDKIKKQLAEEELKIKIKRPSVCPYTGQKLPEIKLLKPTTFYKDKEIMLPTEIREWLAAVPDEDVAALGIDPKYCRPEWMVLTCLLVPPVSVRPSITLESGERSEDDLTHKLVDIMRINQRLEANINAGAPQLIIEDLWELLQYHVTTYFNNETANIPPARHRSGRPLKTLSARLKGKEGRFRYNLSGKRVNFSARTVISPDPSISIDEVGVPLEIAKELTVPLKVTSWNIEHAKKFIISDDYPKAEYVIRPDGKKMRITQQTKQEILNNLTVGSIVERQLIDGDIVLFNRQPSLHRISILCHNAKILPGKTLRLNPLVCPPYNADFDGDEMNLHVIQTEEAKAEAEILMKVHNQILSPRHGQAIIKFHEDYVSGCWFLTRQEAEFDKELTCRFLAIGGITKLPPPDKKDKWSGKLIFSMFLPKNLNCTVNTKFKRKNPDGSPHPDNVVIIKDGILLQGAVDNKALGEILERIIYLEGFEAGKEFLDRVGKVSLEVITLNGFSVSLSNYSLSKDALEQIEKLQDNLKRETESIIAQYKNKTLELIPGRSLRESLEEKIMTLTSKTRDLSGSIVEKHFGTNNTSIIMASIGARGSLLNAIQMASMVGQQAIRNKRPSRGYKGRLLPHFKKGDRGVLAKGFVASSFKKGLSPTEYFQHSMGGRESLVNTAIRTARSGYMQRRLINALQDLIVMSDFSVRDAGEKIIQYVYGGDGIDPMFSRVIKYEEKNEKNKK